MPSGMRLVSVVLELVRTTDVEAEVLGLNGCEGGELDADSSQVSAGNLLIESLGEHAESEKIGRSVPLH